MEKMLCRIAEEAAEGKLFEDECGIMDKLCRLLYARAKDVECAMVIQAAARRRMRRRSACLRIQSAARAYIVSDYIIV